MANIEFDWPSHSRLTNLLDLLPLAANSGLDVLGTSFAVPEFRGLNPFLAPKHPQTPRVHNQWRSRNELTLASVARLRTMFGRFTGFKQSDQPRLALAARRLGSALSRSEGPFRTADSILDVTIALEIMYSLAAGGEVQNKMGTRLAHFLGKARRPLRSLRARSILVFAPLRDSARSYRQGEPRDSARVRFGARPANILQAAGSREVPLRQGLGEDLGRSRLARDPARRLGRRAALLPSLPSR